MFAVLSSAPLRSRARFRTPRLFHGAALAGIAFLGGCALSPAYQRPAAPVESAFPSEGVYAQITAASSGATVTDIGWREFFRDPVLHDLIADALQNNRDIRIAALNVEAARATYASGLSAVCALSSANSIVSNGCSPGFTVRAWLWASSPSEPAKRPSPPPAFGPPGNARTAEGYHLALRAAGASAIARRSGDRTGRIESPLLSCAYQIAFRRGDDTGAPTVR